LNELDRLRQLVTSDPEIMGGTPVFMGTRIPVDVVANILAQGARPPTQLYHPAVWSNYEIRPGRRA